MFQRALVLPEIGKETFFLWGPRQTGKTTLLRARYPDALWIDLLKVEEYLRYLNNPGWLRQELPRQGKTPFVVIDEIQKLPILLDEVHWLHENRACHFALCGSSARKVRRGHTNLLGGRAIRRELFGFTSADLGESWDLVRMLNHGYLPRIYLSQAPARLLNAYAGNYLKEEIAAEGLVRNLPVFSQFLALAALSDTEPVNFTTIARECGVAGQTVKGYFEIMEDTLLGRWLPSYRRRPKRRVAAAPKFYFTDLGLVNFLAKRGLIQPGSELFGKAFENWCMHELTAFHSYHETFAELSYWRLSSGAEVDFIVNDMELAIEAKATRKVTAKHLKGLRSLQQDHAVGRRIVVSDEAKARITEDGIEILPAAEFAQRLWRGELSA